MKIEEFRIYGLRGIVAYEKNLRDTWLDEIPSSLLVTGLNGSGKTTLLDAIATIWGDFAAWQQQKKHQGAQKDWLFRDCRLAAIRFTNVFSDSQRPLWLFKARPNEFEQLREYLAGCDYVGVVDHGKASWRIETHDEQWLEGRRRITERSIAGAGDDVPNVVYLTSDERRLATAKRPGRIVADPPENNWQAVYDPEQPLADTLKYLSSGSPERFREIVDRTNQFLEHKRLEEDFDEDGQLYVRTDSGGRHSIYELSTGERQSLILIGYVCRWLHQGGVLLVDEPDLYLHPSWIEQMAAMLASIVRERNGHFVFTSHSPQLWEDYSREGDRIRLTIQTLNEGNKDPTEANGSAPDHEEDGGNA